MSDGGPLNPAEDDAYRDLFRPEEPVGSAQPAPPAPAPTAAPEAPRQPTVDTGRLFRSARVDTDTLAVAAISGDQAAKLRTLQADGPAPIRVNSAEPRPAATLLAGAPPVSAPPPPIGDLPPMPRESGAPGLRAVGVYAITIGATLLAGIVDIFIGGAGLGWFTGAVFLIATIFCALRVRRSDAAVAVIAAPIAFFVGCITVGQIGMSATGGLIGRVVTTFFMLADNWLWIIGATMIALVIVLIRGRMTD